MNSDSMTIFPELLDRNASITAKPQEPSTMSLMSPSTQTEMGENLRFGHRAGKGLERLQQHIDFALKSLEGLSRQLQVRLFG
jgi:hypothetical protein